MKKTNIKKRKPTKPFKELLKEVKNISQKLMKDKYVTDDRYYSIKTINEIIYNEKAHVVASFKDFLIYDDTSEFLKRLYSTSESLSRLPKIFGFYEQYSKIFANYIILPESKYMYKNIQRKQKIIDNLQKLNSDTNNLDDDNQQIFNTEIYNSLMNLTYTVNQSRSIILNKENSLVSIEGLIHSIGKAEEVKPDLNVLTATSIEKKRFSKVNTGLSTRPTTATSSLYNNIKTFNKKSTVVKNTVTPKAIIQKTDTRKNSIVGHKPNPATNLNILTSLSNATINTLAVKPTSKDRRVSSKVNTTNTRCKVSNITTQKQTFISQHHKGANSMPKLTNNNIYNNFNIISNVSSVVTPSTQINIYNNYNNDDNIISSQINIVEAQTIKADRDTITDVSPKINKIITISNITKKKPVVNTKMIRPYNTTDLKKKPNDSKNLKSTFCGNNTAHGLSTEKRNKVDTSKIEIKEKTLREILHSNLFDNETDRSNTKIKVKFSLTNRLPLLE
jgi:hypothetical protein